MPTVEVNGVRLFYEEHGQGPLVVLVHGGLSDYSEWSDLTAHLSRSNRVVAYSRRNAYPNPIRPDQAAGVSDHADDLASLIHALGEPSAHIVGESYGAVVALECVRRHPALVRTLVLDEPPIPSILNSAEDQGLRAPLETTLTAALAAVARDDPEGAVRTVVDHIEGAAGSYASLPSEVRSGLLRNLAAFRIEFSSGLPDLSADEVAKSLPPTLWLTSSNGARELARITEVLALACGSRAREIPGTTHGSLISAPGYLAAVETFLREHA